MISSHTRLVALLGHPVGHSVSPAMHNAALAVADIDLVYVAADVVDGEVGRAVAGLAALGAVGANVTVPHKRAVMASCVGISDDARAVGAVNTLTFTDDGPVGHNTDVAGFLAGLGAVRTDRTVVLGSGGAARAVLLGLVRRGAEVVVVARDVDRANELRGLQSAGAGSVDVLASHDPAVTDAIAHADLVVNATPLGWSGERLPKSFHGLDSGQVAYDLNYADPPSPFLADAAAAGAETVDGLAMVVGQAAASFQIWTGVHPDVEVMAAAARAARADAPTPSRT